MSVAVLCVCFVLSCFASVCLALHCFVGVGVSAAFCVVELVWFGLTLFMLFCVVALFCCVVLCLLCFDLCWVVVVVA